MNKNDVIKQVNQVLIEKFEMKAEELVPTAQLIDDLHLDSLDFVDMFIIVEKLGGFTEVPNIDIQSMRTLDDVYNLITDLYAQKQNPKPQSPPPSNPTGPS